MCRGAYCGSGARMPAPLVGQARALRYAIEHQDPATERRRCERDLLKAAMASLAAQDDRANRNESRRYLPGVRHD